MKMINIFQTKYLFIGLVAIFAISAFALPVSAQYYDYGYDRTPTYYYGHPYDRDYRPSSPLQVSCYPMPLSAQVGQSVTWYANAYGGDGVAYNYTWTGDEGLYGYGQSVTKSYAYSGYKNASVSVISGGQTKSINCSGSVNVTGSYVTPVYPPVYVSPIAYNSPIYVTCSANTSYVNQGGSATWTAYASGGNGYFTYNWTGTDGLYGYNQTASYIYNSSGQKTAAVTVSSNGQVVTQSCTNAVTVGNTYGYSYYQPVSNYGYSAYQTYPITYATNYGTNYLASNSLDIACFVDPTNATANQPVTWKAEVVGGVAPYTYTWTGSDGVSGSSQSLIKYYSTSGSKSAVVTVTSADGKTATHACSNTVAIGNSSTRTAVARSTSATSAQTAPVATQNTAQTAASLFSLSNVPWGWVAVLVILVLFFTILYLLFNKSKI